MRLPFEVTYNGTVRHKQILIGSSKYWYLEHSRHLSEALLGTVDTHTGVEGKDLEAIYGATGYRSASNESLATELHDNCNDNDSEEHSISFLIVDRIVPYLTLNRPLQAGSRRKEREIAKKHPMPFIETPARLGGSCRLACF